MPRRIIGKRVQVPYGPAAVSDELYLIMSLIFLGRRDVMMTPESEDLPFAFVGIWLRAMTRCADLPELACVFLVFFLMSFYEFVII